jgi:hypothetical protein
MGNWQRRARLRLVVVDTIKKTIFSRLARGRNAADASSKATRRAKHESAGQQI